MNLHCLCFYQKLQRTGVAAARVSGLSNLKIQFSQQCAWRIVNNLLHAHREQKLTTICRMKMSFTPAPSPIIRRSCSVLPEAENQTRHCTHFSRFNQIPKEGLKWGFVLLFWGILFRLIFRIYHLAAAL